MNEKHLIFIIGLPASGKTTLAKNKYHNYKLFDDVSISYPNPSSLVFDVRDEEKSVIIDPYCSLKEIQDIVRIIFKKFSISFIYFENNPAQCLINAKTRPEKKVEDLIRYLTTKYYIPDGEKTVAVYDPNQPLPLP